MIVEESSGEYKNGSQSISTMNSIGQTENHCQQLVTISKSITKNNKIVNHKKKKIRLKRVDWLDIHLPLKYNNVFQLPGHIIIEIHPDKNESIQFQVNKAQKSDQFFTIYQNKLKQESSFGEVIYLLENSQSQQNYEAGQLLKTYQKTHENQDELIKFIKQQADYDKLLELQKERQNFKDNYTVDYAKQNFCDDDFYIISSSGVNIDQEVSELNYMLFSKAYFTLIGVDEQFICSSQVLKFLYSLVMPPHIRRFVFKEILSNYVNNKFPYTKQTAPFEFYTLDKIKIEQIPYPDHLKNVYLDSLHLSMNNVQVRVFNIQDYHLKKILEQRTQSPIKHVQDLEYTIFSEILLEKFYPKQLNELQQKQILEEHEEKGIDEEKRCSYKYVNKKN